MKSKRNVAVILGTRPEIIKLSPVIRALEKSGTDYFILHTGQHYSYEMDRLFFRELDLPAPLHQLEEKSSAANRQADHTGRMMAAIESVLIARKPSAVLVQGDTNTVLAGSLAAVKIPGIRLGHVEAGLRSYDRGMPEEINRVVSDHVSHCLFAPTVDSRKILLGEGIANENIFVTGNTIVDAVFQNLRIARRKVDLRRWKNERASGFFLMTLHRQENVDHPKVFRAILQGLKAVVSHFKKPIIFPIHPRTLSRLEKFALNLPQGVLAVKPVGFLEFLALEKEAELLLTDSGGVQEEGCILKVPCVTLRTSTERPETVKVGANLVAGHEPDRILACAKKMVSRKRNWRNPFGDGRTGERIVKIISKS